MNCTKNGLEKPFKTRTLIMKKEFKAAKLILECSDETDNRLLIKQSESEYFANGWSITSDVEKFVRCCLEGGLKNIIRPQHPRHSNRKSGVKYIGFSFPEDKLWSVCIDQFSPNSDKSFSIKQVSVQSRWEPILLANSIPYERQAGSGGSLFVPYDQLPQLIQVISSKKGSPTPTLQSPTAGAVTQSMQKVEFTADSAFDVSDMTKIEDDFKIDSGLNSRELFKIYYSRIYKSPLLILGFNPGGMVGPEYKRASDGYYENGAHDYLQFENDPGYKIAGPMMQILRPLAQKLAIDVATIPKTNLIFRRSSGQETLNLGVREAIQESMAGLLRIIDIVEPRVIILEGKTTGDLFKKFYCNSDVKQVGEEIKEPNGTNFATVYKHENTTLIHNQREAHIFSIGHPSRFGQRKSWDKIVQELLKNI